MEHPGLMDTALDFVQHVLTRQRDEVAPCLMFLAPDPHNPAHQAVGFVPLEQLEKRDWVRAATLLVTKLRVSQFALVSSTWASTPPVGKELVMRPKDDPNHKHGVMVVVYNRGVPPTTMTMVYYDLLEGVPANVQAPLAVEDPVDNLQLHKAFGGSLSTIVGVCPVCKEHGGTATEVALHMMEEHPAEALAFGRRGF